MACTVKGCGKPAASHGHCAKHQPLMRAQNIDKVPVPASERVSLQGGR